MPPFDGVPRPTRGVGFAKKLRGSGFHSVAIHGEQEDAELKVRDDTFCWEEGRWKDASFSFVAISQATACQKLVLKLERPLPSHTDARTTKRPWSPYSVRICEMCRTRRRERSTMKDDRQKKCGLHSASGP